MHLRLTIRAAVVTSLTALILGGPLLCAAPTAAQAPSSSGEAAAASGLNFSPSQKVKADARQAQFQKDVMALRTDMKLNPPQKQAKYTSLAQAMDRDMLAILTPSQRAQVMKQRQINADFRRDGLALQSNKSLTDAQKKARYLKLVENARNASIALLPPAQRGAAQKRSIAAEQAQEAQVQKITEAQQLNQQLQSSQSPAQSQKLQAIALSAKSAMQAIIADKSLSDPVKTEKITAIRKDALTRDLALLTPTQRGLYSRIQALVAPQTR